MKRIVFSLIPIAFLATVAPANGVIVAQYDFEDTLFGTSTDSDLTSVYLYNPDGITTNGSDGVNVDKVVVEATVVPEPSTCAMIGLSAVLLGAIKCFRRKRS
jgi:hypothetical protein